MQAGRWRKKAERPEYAHVLVRSALKKERLRFWEFVKFYNKHGQLQYLDFVVNYKGKLVVLLWDNRRFRRYRGRWKKAWGYSGLKPYEKENRRRKLEFIEERGYPYMILSTKGVMSSDEWRIVIRRWLHSLKKTPLE